MTGTSLFLYKNGLDPLEFYSNLANPTKRFVTIQPGLRREQIAERLTKVLSWNASNTEAFLNTAPQDERGVLDGYYMPGSYWFDLDATGADVANQMLRKFNTEVSNKVLAKQAGGKNGAVSGRNNTSGKGADAGALPTGGKINLDTAVRIASIIQREAAGPSDMKIISGVIWNRLFRGMTLDMDATLQYAKASSTDWWPDVLSKDKYIDSDYNTYQNKGLPPTAIANPSLAAIEAAFNPQKTECLFYIHSNRNIYCAKTYQAHKNNIQRYLVGKK